MNTTLLRKKEEYESVSGDFIGFINDFIEHFPRTIGVNRWFNVNLVLKLGGVLQNSRLLGLIMIISGTLRDSEQTAVSNQTLHCCSRPEIY